MIFITKVNGDNFLEQWIELNVNKVVIKILQGSVVTTQTCALTQLKKLIAREL